MVIDNMCNYYTEIILATTFWPFKGRTVINITFEVKGYFIASTLKSKKRWSDTG